MQHGYNVYWLLTTQRSIGTRYVATDDDFGIACDLALRHGACKSKVCRTMVRTRGCACDIGVMAECCRVSLCCLEGQQLSADWKSLDETCEMYHVPAPVTTVRANCPACWLC